MTFEKSRHSSDTTSELGETKAKGNAMSPERQTLGASRESDRYLSLNSDTPAKPRILIVTDERSIYKELKIILLNEGFASACEETMTAACNSAKSGRFQVVVTVPVLLDGSWKRLVDVESRCTPGFVIILLASTLDRNQWAQMVEDGAFDLLDPKDELSRVALAARCALWAAYLKGAGPHPEHRVH